MKSIEEYYKEMKVAMMRSNTDESKEQSMGTFMNGLNCTIKRITKFQLYGRLVMLVHQKSME
jgi:hypothetical protein